MSKRRLLYSSVLALTLIAGGSAYAIVHKTAGPKPDGTAITPVGFKVTPADDDEAAQGATAEESEDGER